MECDLWVGSEPWWRGWWRFRTCPPWWEHNAPAQNLVLSQKTPCGSPPLQMWQNYLLVFYSQLFKRVPVVSCLGALLGPRENPPPPPQNVTKLFILDFNCQPLGMVPICFMSVGPYGPGGVLSHFEGGGTRHSGPIWAFRLSINSTLTFVIYCIRVDVLKCRWWSGR